ncbi:hypothetical protein [Streptomyces sp. CRN 30]|uniref:hypothetical protein n=1 Tax=Streptomyces sp. CRN 30 TaxID=3075613 RepID=UPI002A7ED917|nr:hypothetical protein [Streptomyces sp. CRN 30]
MKALTRPTVVPYIAAWSGELQHLRRIVYSKHGGIGFADEAPEDRDQFGVLWNGRAVAQGAGHPRYGEVHPERQRLAMQYLRCQVCGGAPARDSRGMLWLIEDDRGRWAGWPERLLTTHPPICIPCANAAAVMCPHLAGHYVAVRVQDSEVCGVHGRIWAPSAFGYPVRTEMKDVVAYGTTDARWVLAGQLVRSLHGCTIVDLRRDETCDR